MMYDIERIEVLMPRWIGVVQRSGCHTKISVLPQSRLEVSRCRCTVKKWCDDHPKIGVNCLTFGVRVIRFLME